MNNTPPIINALWIGGQLGQIARACLTSFVMRGHNVHLYTYDNLPDIPDGITVCDGNDIIHHSKIFKHTKKQSYGPFSDIFSYELLKKMDNAIYVDCDIYCLKPMHIPDNGYLFGYENDTLLNVAVLALPKDSELLNALCDIGNNPQFVPEWYSPNRQLRLKIKRFFGKARHIADMSWGVTGPSAITHYTKKLQLTHFVQDLDVLYPIQHHEAKQKLLDENLNILDVISERSVCVHLYNETLRHVDLKTIPSTCILSKMLANEI